MFSLSLFFFYSVAVVLCQVCTVFLFLFLILVLQYINIFTFLTFPFFEITAIFFNKKRKLVIFNDASAASFVFNLLMNPSPREAGGFFRLLPASLFASKIGRKRLTEIWPSSRPKNFYRGSRWKRSGPHPQLNKHPLWSGLLEIWKIKPRWADSTSRARWVLLAN